MISVITPSHNPQWLKEAYNSLLLQNQEFEWVVVPNNGASFLGFNDRRIKIFSSNENKIGSLKNYAASKTTGDIILELDHDDVLLPNAFTAIEEAFKEPDISMVYSDSLYLDIETGKQTNKYSPHWGWKYKKYEIDGASFDVPISPDPIPQNLSRIWYAPNHLRAWRASDYFRLGGHNIELTTADDHEFIIRNYLNCKIKKIVR